MRYYLLLIAVLAFYTLFQKPFTPSLVVFSNKRLSAMDKLIHVVEDDEDIRFIVEYILIESGYRVESSATAKEFHTYMARARPDLILLDVMLLDGNGIELCRDLKSDIKTDDIKIIIMSAHAAEKAVLEEACADDFISKPFDLDYLIDHVKKILPA